MSAGAIRKVMNNLLELVLLAAALLATVSQYRHLINEMLNTFARNSLRHISPLFQI
jgi:hypothetical protein